MNPGEEIARWVKTHPLFLIRFDESLSEALRESRQGFEHLTLARPHSVFSSIRLPTPCLLEIQEEHAAKYYLAAAIRKTTVTTFESRLTIKKLRPLYPDSIHAIMTSIPDVRMQHLLRKRLSSGQNVIYLSPKLSACLIEILASYPENQATLTTVSSFLTGLSELPHNTWAQEDAIASALKIFGIRGEAIPEEVKLKKGTSSGLELIGSYLYEDNVIQADASHLPGFDMISRDLTGRAVFQKGDERLIIYTANKLPLEQMLGVDLIYINEPCRNIVMIQYKMLEKVAGGRDWQFRPDTQLQQEISRMQLPDIKAPLNDYRLHSNPFFLKFVKREITDKTPQSFFLSLDHLCHILASPHARGPRGGLLLSYTSLGGIYLRESDMIGLIRSGYIGTHSHETAALTTIIHEAARGNKAIVLAWQKKFQKFSELVQ